MSVQSMRIAAFALCAVWGMMGCSGGNSGASEFVGEFSGEKLTLNVQQEGGGFGGIVSLDGKEFPLQGSEQGGKLTGSFESEGRAFEFVAEFSDGQLRFETGRTKYRLDRVVTENPLATNDPNPLAQSETPSSPAGESGRELASPEKSETVSSKGPPQDSAVGTRVDDDTAAQLRQRQEDAGRVALESPTLGGTYKHPLGFFFRHPESWRVEEQQAGLLIVTPADVHRVNGQPAEAILVLGDTAAGLTKPDDPQVVQYIEGLVRAEFPFLSRDGEVEARTYPTHPGARIAWKGKSPTGLDARAAMWVTIMKGYAIGIFAISARDRFEGRARVVEDMFRTFGFTKPQTDPRLYGNWRYTNITRSGTFSMVSEQYLTLRADGSCVRSSQSMGGMEHHDSAGNLTGSSSVDSGKSDREQGTWAAAGKKIILRWANDSQEWEYIISGGSMLWKANGSKKLWERTR